MKKTLATCFGLAALFFAGLTVLSGIALMSAANPSLYALAGMSMLAASACVSGMNQAIKS